MARKRNHHQTKDGKVIEGLAHDKDGRWRIIATGQKFSEKEEAKAIARFLEIKRQNPDVNETQRLEISVPTDAKDAQVLMRKIMAQAGGVTQGDEDFEFDVDSRVFWSSLKKLMIKHQKLVEQNTGIRINLAEVVRDAIRCQKIIDIYSAKTEDEDQAKSACIAAWKKMIDHIGATTLAHLTVEALSGYRTALAKENTKNTTKNAMMRRAVKVVRFALKHHDDKTQITEALTNFTALYPFKDDSEDTPHPISVADFRTLLDGCKDDPEWFCTILLSMNLCCYLGEVGEMEWDEFDFKANTYLGRRPKNGVTRIGVLWPETVAALQKLGRRGQSPYVFTSSHGTKFNKASRHDTFKSLRERLGVPAVQFSWIRDGAYTCACQHCDLQTSVLFAAHTLPGQMDAYVRRNPEMVRTASDAVREAYLVAKNPS